MENAGCIGCILHHVRFRPIPVSHHIQPCCLRANLQPTAIHHAAHTIYGLGVIAGGTCQPDDVLHVRLVEHSIERLEPLACSIAKVRQLVDDASANALLQHSVHEIFGGQTHAVIVGDVEISGFFQRRRSGCLMCNDYLRIRKGTLDAVYPHALHGRDCRGNEESSRDHAIPLQVIHGEDKASGFPGTWVGQDVASRVQAHECRSDELMGHACVLTFHQRMLAKHEGRSHGHIVSHVRQNSAHIIAPRQEYHGRYDVTGCHGHGHGA